MFNRVPFKREHTVEMLSQASNLESVAFYTGTNFDYLERSESFTGLLNGTPAVSGGIIEIWDGRGYIWTLFDERIGSCFVPVFRGIKSFLDEFRPRYNRLEITVPCDFKKGIRRAKLLGFRVELERAVKFLPGGKDACLLVMEGGR